jgi:hypothetical protein
LLFDGRFLELADEVEQRAADVWRVAEQDRLDEN